MNTPSTTETPTTSSRRKKIAAYGAAGALVVLAGGYALTSAVFNDTETVTGNSVGTASLEIGEAVATALEVEDLLPGATAPAETVLAFSNGGSVPFSYTVTVSNVNASLGSPDGLLGWIPVTVTAGGASQSGTLAAPPSVTVDSLAVDADAEVQVTVGLDDDADNAAKDRETTFDVVVTANQITGS